MKKIIIGIIVLFLVAGTIFFVSSEKNSSVIATNFEECVMAGNPVMESYPRQCRTDDGKIFVEEISGDSSAGRIRGAEEVSIKVGETREAAGVSITLHEVLQDFRCGTSVSCPEFGGVAVRVTLKVGEEMVSRGMASDEADYEFAGYAISIPKMAPTRFADEVIREEDYVITFKVAPLALEEVEENPGL